MSTLFTINFRREAYRREVAKARVRVVRVGMWALYFGALGVVLGLYGLNCTSLSRRTAALERQTARLRRQPATSGEWRPGASEAALVRAHLENPRQWRDRLTHLARVLPAGALLTNLQYNSENFSGNADQKLVLTGVIRSGSGTDRMAQVMSFVSAISRDSVFAGGYRNIRLVTTRASQDGSGAEFVVECR